MIFNYTEKQIVFSYLEIKALSTRKFLLMRKMISSFLGIRSLEGNIEDFTFFYSSKRSDQNKLFDKIYDSCPFEKSRLKLKKINCINFRIIFDFFTNYNFIQKIQGVMNKYYEEVNTTYSEKLYIYFDYLLQKDFLRNIKKIDMKKMNHFVVLADALLYEQTAVSYFKEKGINTITAQHAIFFDSDNFEFVQKLNYFHAPSNYVLTWGNNTNKLFEKMSPNIKIIICGNPITEFKEVQMKNYIAVTGDSIQFIEQNKEMIKLAEEYAKMLSLKVYIRLHPADNENNYIIDRSVTFFNSDIDEAIFIISHASSMLCRYIVEGRRVLRYKSDIRLDFVSSELEFSNLEELQFLTKHLDTIDFLKLGKQNIAYCGDESVERYREAFKIIKKEVYNE